MDTMQISISQAKACTIPYAYKLKVEELDHLIKLIIIEPVQFAEWAAPIVDVLKSDKKSN